MPNSSVDQLPSVQWFLDLSSPNLLKKCAFEKVQNKSTPNKKKRPKSAETTQKKAKKSKPHSRSCTALDWRTEDVRPSLSNAQLIALALRSSIGATATLAQICQFLIGQFAYFQKRADQSEWKFAIGQVLEESAAFKKVPLVQNGQIVEVWWSLVSMRPDWDHNYTKAPEPEECPFLSSALTVDDRQFISEQLNAFPIEIAPQPLLFSAAEAEDTFPLEENINWMEAEQLQQTPPFMGMQQDFGQLGDWEDELFFGSGNLLLTSDF